MFRQITREKLWNSNNRELQIFQAKQLQLRERGKLLLEVMMTKMLRMTKKYRVLTTQLSMLIYRLLRR